MDPIFEAEAARLWIKYSTNPYQPTTTSKDNVTNKMRALVKKIFFQKNQQ